MSVALDGKALTVTGWTESFEVLKSEFDKWEAGACKRKLRVYGYVRVYTLDCVEEGVAWANSAVKYFQEKAAQGALVALTSSLAVRVVSSINVYVRSVKFSAEDCGGKNVRCFTLQLQEAA